MGKDKQKMAKSVRMADIAGKLGVSVVTVSKGLRGKDGVSEELRAQILRTAEEMGYEVRGGREDTNSYVIGIVTSSRYLERGSSFYWSLYERLLTHLSAGGDFGFLEVVSPEDEEGCVPPRIVQEGRADGIIMMGPMPADYIRMLDRLPVPFTMLDTYDTSLPFDTVISDGYFGMSAMTEHLIELGHRRIMYVGTVGATSSITDRYFGYCRAMTEAGLTVTPDMVIPDRKDSSALDVHLPKDIAQRATALVCNCDLTAYQVLHQLTAMGLRVPEDISLVGFDNYALPDVAGIRLTTYDVDQDSMAKASAQQVRDRIRDPLAKRDVRTIVGGPIQGESVRPIVR